VIVISGVGNNAVNVEYDWLYRNSTIGGIRMNNLYYEALWVASNKWLFLTS